MNRVEFFTTLYQSSEGDIEIRAIPGMQGFFPTDDHKGIDSHCSKFAQNNLYFGVATRNGGGTKKHIVNIPAVWNDGDFKQTPREILADKLGTETRIPPKKQERQYQKPQHTSREY